MMIFEDAYKDSKRQNKRKYKINILIHKINTMWISSVDNAIIIGIIHVNLRVILKKQY